MDTPAKKRASAATAAAIILATTAGCAHHANRADSPGTTLRVGFIGTVGGNPSGPEGWAYGRGLLLPALKPAGITKITFTAFPNGPDLNEAVAAGSLDLGMQGDTPAIVGHAAGLPTRLINQTSVGMNCWLIAAPDGPKTLDDLRGKTVATSKGSYMARYLLGLLAEKGLTSQVKFVHLLPSDAEAALRRGDIAAYASPYGPLLVSHGLREIDEAANHPDLEGTSVTVATQKYLDAHPGFPAVWNKARAVAISDVVAHQAEFDAYQAQRIRLTPAIYHAIYPTRTYVPEPLTARGVALLDGTKAFLVQQHLAKTDFSLTGWEAPAVQSATQTAALPKEASK